MSRREPSRTIVLERSGGSSLWWFLIGGALGAGLGLLFAPHSGDRTRREVGRKLGKLRDAGELALDDLREAVAPAERVHRSLAEADELEEELEDELEAPGLSRVAEAEDDGEPPEASRRGPAAARRELEQRLAEARARRRRALADEDEEPVA